MTKEELTVAVEEYLGSYTKVSASDPHGSVWAWDFTLSGLVALTEALGLEFDTVVLQGSYDGDVEMSW